MNVWVVLFDESENGDDPLLRVFKSWLEARNAVERMTKGTAFELDVDDELDEMREISILRYDPDEGDRLQIHIRQVRVEEPTSVPTKEVL